MLRIALLILLLLNVPALRAQLLKPSKTEALILLQVRSSEGIPARQERVVLENERTKKTYKASTSLDGLAELLVPCGDNYLLHFPQAQSFARLIVPKKQFHVSRHTITYDGKPVLPDNSMAMRGDTVFFYGDSVQNLKATYSIVLLHFKLTDYRGQPLDSEVVTLRGLRNRVFYKGITGKKGEVFMLLPKGDQYDLDFAYEKNIDRLDYPMEAGFRTADVQYRYEGSRAARERIAEEKERLEKERLEQITFNKQEFERWSARIDSLAAVKKNDSTGTHGRPHPDSLIEKPITIRMVDPVVTDVLARNFFWNPQLFVTDLSGSMAPYSRQLGAWFRLRVKTNPDLNLVFFNDGDGKPDGEKVLGETGGIHYCLKCNEKQLEKTVQETIAGGTGGDAPENNIEALIKSIARVKPTQPVVMIADNKAPVKDIVLLDQVTTPLRIILCGVNGPIHPDYIKMAYATKGSLHTVKEDIYKLPEISEGRIVSIAGYKYAYSRGRFVLVK